MQYELGFPTQSAPLVWDDSHAIPRGQTVTWHFTTPATLTPNCVGYVELVEHANNSGGAAVICPRMGALNFTAGDLTTQIGPGRGGRGVLRQPGTARLHRLARSARQGACSFSCRARTTTSTWRTCRGASRPACWHSLCSVSFAFRALRAPDLSVYYRRGRVCHFRRVRVRGNASRFGASCTRALKRIAFTQVGGSDRFTVKGKSLMATTMTDVQSFTLSIVAEDAAGEPTTFGAPPTWAADSSGVVVVTRCRGRHERGYRQCRAACARHARLSR